MDGVQQLARAEASWLAVRHARGERRVQAVQVAADVHVAIVVIAVTIAATAAGSGDDVLREQRSQLAAAAGGEVFGLHHLDAVLVHVTTKQPAGQ